jgi:hypothetical protein
MSVFNSGLFRNFAIGFGLGALAIAVAVASQMMFGL